MAAAEPLPEPDPRRRMHGVDDIESSGRGPGVPVSAPFGEVDAGESGEAGASGAAAGRGDEGPTSRPVDLDHTIATFREALADLSAELPQRAPTLFGLGFSLLDRYYWDGGRADLDDAIGQFAAAVDVGADTDPDRGLWLGGLARARQTRYWRDGEPADLEAALRAGVEAAAATPSGHRDRSATELILTGLLLDRYRALGREDDLVRAVAVGRSALAAVARHDADRPAYLDTLGVVLCTRPAGEQSAHALDEGIDHLREAVDITPGDQPDRALRLSHLAEALFDRYRQDLDAAYPGAPADLDDLDEAAAAGQDAVAMTSSDHPDRAGYVLLLGRILAVRHELTGRSDDGLDARQACWEAASSPTTPSAERLDAALIGAHLAWRTGDVAFARQAYALAVDEILPLILWPAQEADDVLRRRAELAELPALAADCAVRTGRPEQAVEVLENGRTALWAPSLPGDLARLRAAAPTLAADLDRARRVLDSPVPPAGAAGSPAGREDAHRRLRAAASWKRSLAAVRRRDGFATFLRPARFAEIAAGIAGPVVLVSAGEPDGYALVVTGAAVRVIELPGLSAGTAYDWAAEWLEICQRAESGTAGFRELEAGRARLFDLLEHLWQLVGRPVLDGLGHTGSADGPLEQRPRVWWCPVGPLALLPLAAAGRYPRRPGATSGRDSTGRVPGLAGPAPEPTAETVADRVVSSYTATLADLRRATHPAPVLEVRQLAVGVQGLPGWPRLSGVPAELHVLADHLPEPARARHLTGSAATRAAFRAGRAERSWLHVSGPVRQDPWSAATSAFLLADGPLSIGDLDPVDGDLACLLAVLTATGERLLPDVALHLAAAVQRTGYRHVLGQLWNIADALAPAVADAVYAELLAGGTPTADRAPHALHRAVAQLREAVPGDPLVWAPFLHFGP